MAAESAQLLIVAAEASADLHAARVLDELRALVPGLTAFGMGGPRLRAAGLEAIYPSEAVSVMGIAEVIPAIPRILGMLAGLTRAAAERRPRAALLVDSPDFNLRLAKRLKKLGIRIVYFISPMIWAWRRGRAKKIARVVDRMLCILPFEEAAYAGSGASVRFVGHPFADQPAPEAAGIYRARLGLDASRTTIALLPGSRRSEIARLFPPMLEAAEAIKQRHPDAQFVVPVAPGLTREMLAPFLAAHAALSVTLSSARAGDAVGASDAAIVKSGTAVLEAALMLRPMVAVYRLSWLSYLVGRALVRLAHFTLVNLLAGRTVVTELLQREASPARMANEVERLLGDRAAREEQLRGLSAVKESLGPPGAARRVAEEVARYLTS